MNFLLASHDKVGEQGIILIEGKSIDMVGTKDKKPGMTVQELYDHITKQITPETALKRLLESGLITYQKIRFEKGEEVHPIIIISMATMEMGWSFIVEQGVENIEGLVVGTDDYIKRTMPK